MTRPPTAETGAGQGQKTLHINADRFEVKWQWQVVLVLFGNELAVTAAVCSLLTAGSSVT